MARHLKPKVQIVSLFQISSSRTNHPMTKLGLQLEPEAMAWNTAVKV